MCYVSPKGEVGVKARFQGHDNEMNYQKASLRHKFGEIEAPDLCCIETNGLTRSFC